MRSVLRGLRRDALCLWLLSLAVAHGNHYDCIGDLDCNIETATDAKVKGHCEDGRCVCSAGYGGRNCSFGMSSVFYEHNVYTHFPADRPLDLAGWSAGPKVYHAVAEMTDAQLIVEVGTWKGLSASYLAQWLQIRGRGVLVCVDTWLGALEFWTRRLGTATRNLQLIHGYPSVYYTFLANMVHLKLQDYVVPFPVPSRLAWEFFVENKIKADVVHIDAAHEYDDVKEDIHMWWKVVAPGGILMGDDYIGAWPGVVKAVNEFLELTGLRMLELNETVNPRDDRVKWTIRKPL